MKKYIKDNKLLILFILVLISFCLFSMIFVIYENDYFWHIKAGEYMVKHHTILTKDIFSWNLVGKYWFSHEWLFEIILYRFYKLFGNLHIYIYTFICFFILLISIFILHKKEYLKNIPFCLIWLVASTILIHFLQARPHLITYVFISFLVYILFDLYNNENSKKIYFIPLISLLWVNIHGGSSNLIYILPIIFIISGLFTFNSSKLENKRYSKKQIIKYSLCIILGFLPLFINPHGIKMITYPYTNMTNKLMISNITEWQPTNLNNIQHYMYFILAFIIFMIMFISKTKIRLIDFILFLAGLYLGLKSIRFWPFIYIFMSHSIFYYVKERKKDPGTNIILLILSIFCILVFVSNIPILRLKPPKIVSDKAINILKREKPNKLYNYYDYGGYLIYKDIDVFIDGRADLYSKYNYRDYLDIFYLKYNYNKLLNKYNFDYLIVPRKSGLSTYLNENNKYDCIFNNKKIVIYKLK